MVGQRSDGHLIFLDFLSSCGNRGTSRDTAERKSLAKKADSVICKKSGWLGRLDSNQGMAVPKTAALPLGYAPCAEALMKAGAQ